MGAYELIEIGSIFGNWESDIELDTQAEIRGEGLLQQSEIAIFLYCRNAKKDQAVASHCL